MIPLAELETGAAISMWPFPAGDIPPDQVSGVVTANAITPIPEMHNAVYVPNPGERLIYIYHYMEGMPTPSGILSNYRFEPKALLTVGKNIRETATGVFTTTVSAPPAGEYDLLFLLEDPRIIHCFDFDVAPDPVIEASRSRKIAVAPLGERWELPVGEEFTVAFQLREVETEQLKIGLKDVVLQIYTTRGWQDRVRATPVEEGAYEVKLTVPYAGVYYISVASSSLGIRLQDVRPVMIRAVEQ